MADGIAVLQPDGSNVKGVVRFSDEDGGVAIRYWISGLSDGEHGFHIHRYGDLTDGCTSACEHFDPKTQILESKIAVLEDALGFLRDGRGFQKKNWRTGQPEKVIYVGQYQYSAEEIQERITKISNQLSRRHHGGLDTKMRHFGDLGNITSSDGVAEGKLFLDKGRLNTSRYGILGRMIIVHADRDDLGTGGDEESLKTGNAGKRLACGVIGLADPDTDTMTMSAEDDLPDWVDHFLPGPNINPHDDPAYDEPYVKCESSDSCPDPARTGPFNYSGGYIGKITACRECWQAILDHYEEEFQGAVEEDDGGDFDFEDPTDSDSFREEWAAEDDYDSTYGKEPAKIRRRLKNKLMGEATMGTKAGQWSARKSQELKRRYEAACERKGIKPYKGSKTTKQKDLSNWSKQGWRTASGRKSSVTGEPYFPTKAVKALKDKELYAKAKRQKAAATRAGKQRATYSKDIQAVVARYRAEGDDRSVPRNWDLIMSDPHADMGLYPNGQPRLPPLDDIPVAESLDDLRNIFSGFGADELHTGGDNKLAIIGFPLTAYRGVASDVHWMGNTGERYDYLSTLDGGVIGGRCGGLAVLGNNSNTPPVSIDLSVALDFAIGRKSSVASLPPDYGIQLSKPITYSIDLQDYLVQNIRLASDESSLGVPGGIHIDDAIPLMDFGEHSDIYASETIDDLDDESLMIRMEDLAERMDAIVQRIGSYPDAERDPEYLRLVEQHTAYARVLARRHGFGAEDGSDSGCYNPDHWDCDNCFEVCLVCHPEKIGGPHPESGDDLCMSCSAQFMARKEPCECGSTRRCIECVQCFGCQVEIHEGGDYGMVCNGCAPKYFDAESDPVSSVAAGTTDALNDFANSQDTDDKFYFIGGLVGGLAIAVLGNIISDRLQDVYFPHWWDNRGGSSS